jgi:hypothetical protein
MLMICLEGNLCRRDKSGFLLLNKNKKSFTKVIDYYKLHVRVLTKNTKPERIRFSRKPFSDGNVLFS